MKKVWAYTIGKSLLAHELDEINSAGKKFVSAWTAHENKLEAEFEIIQNRIILVKVDEAIYGASGCSIDKLVRFVKELEGSFQVELLNRLLVPYEKNNGIAVMPAAEVKEKLALGEISAQTPVYLTSITNDKELMTWKKPLKETWLNKYL